jgi:hypothetical protein
MSESLTLTIRRHGEFSVRFTGSNADQCGLPGTQILRYDVRIVGDEDHLTDQGFIIDNNAIHSYFLTTYDRVRDFESCERIAARACRDFKAMFGRGELRDVVAREIEVTIAGGPNAGLTAHWIAPRAETQPVFTRGTSVAEAEGRVPGTPQYARRREFVDNDPEQVPGESHFYRRLDGTEDLYAQVAESIKPKPRPSSSRREIAPGVVGHALGGYSTQRAREGR